MDARVTTKHYSPSIYFARAKQLKHSYFAADTVSSISEFWVVGERKSEI